MSKVQDYIQENLPRFQEELFDLLRIPSVSADPAYREDVKRTAAFVKDSLEKAGADVVEVVETKGFPVVYAEKIVDPSAPTILIYGHYDVQPPDPMDLWDSPPFEPVVKKTKLHPEGAIFARGACDDKGQMFMHVKAFEAMVKTQALTCNVKFMIEGEEEVGSENLASFLKSEKERLACDVILVSDTALVAKDVPSITVGLRGLSYVQVEVIGPNRDLHSGVYGGGVANPINVLCNLIASLTDASGKITVAGFYDNVQELTPQERQAIAQIPFSQEAYNEDLGIRNVFGEAGFSTVERTSIRPTLDVNGIWGGYTGEGAKTVLPSKAQAKISMRLVPNQTPEEITEKFKKHFESIAPDYVKVKVTPHHGGNPAVVPVDSDEYRAAAKAMAKSFGKDPVPARGGGSIPIVSLFEQVLGVKTVLMGFGLDTDAIHSPNEHYGLFNFRKGIETIPEFFTAYADLKNN
ncbi:MAG: dipeptidase [Luteibaculum sp.]